MPDKLTIHIYPSDCDSAGHVNHAYMLTLLERARWAALETHLPFADYIKRNQWAVVRHIEASYSMSVMPGDDFNITTGLVSVGNTSFSVRQTAHNQRGSLVCDATTVYVTISPEGKPIPVPDEWRQIFFAVGVEPVNADAVPVDVTDPDFETVSIAETTLAARAGAVLFRYRGWLPLLFLAIPLLARGDASTTSWIVGGSLIAAGELWRLAGVAVAGTTTRRRSRRVQKLVTHGVFGWSRNPLYNGNFLVWMGFVAISGVLWFLPAAVLIFAAEYSLIVRYEEGVLETTFGRQYLDYKRCTPRWIPSKPKDPAHGGLNWREAWRSEISTFLQYAVLAAAFAAKDLLRS